MFSTFVTLIISNSGQDIFQMPCRTQSCERWQKPYSNIKMTPESILVLIFLIIGLAILISNIWNIVGIKRLEKTRHFKDEQLNDSKYFELKYKQEFLLTTFSIVIAVIVFIGYNSYSSLKENLKNDVEQKIASTTKKIDAQKDTLNRQQEKINSLNNNLQVNLTKLSNINDLIALLEQHQQELKNKLDNSKQSVVNYEKSIRDLQNKIAEIKNKNIIKQELYIVNSVKYSYKEYWEYVKYNFDTLKTVNNEPLPIFSEPPTIIPFTNNGVVMTIKNVTTNSFEMTASNNTTGDSPNNFPVTLLISVIEK
jgi:hypothetical protein